MSVLSELSHSWRLSRYELELRRGDVQLGDDRWQSWTRRADIGKVFNGIALTEVEYLRVENNYIEAVLGFARAVNATMFRTFELGPKGSVDLAPLVLRSDLAPLARACLRDELGCALESVDGDLQIEFGWDMYFRIGASSPCPAAIAEAERFGLYVEPGFRLTLWDDEDYGE